MSDILDLYGDPLIAQVGSEFREVESAARAFSEAGEQCLSPTGQKTWNSFGDVSKDPKGTLGAFEKLLEGKESFDELKGALDRLEKALGCASSDCVFDKLRNGETAGLEFKDQGKHQRFVDTIKDVGAAYVEARAQSVKLFESGSALLLAIQEADPRRSRPIREVSRLVAGLVRPKYLVRSLKKAVGSDQRLRRALDLPDRILEDPEGSDWNEYRITHALGEALTRYPQLAASLLNFHGDLIMKRGHGLVRGLRWIDRERIAYVRDLGTRVEGSLGGSRGARGLDFFLREYVCASQAPSLIRLLGDAGPCKLSSDPESVPGKAGRIGSCDPASSDRLQCATDAMLPVLMRFSEMMLQLANNDALFGGSASGGSASADLDRPRPEEWDAVIQAAADHLREKKQWRGLIPRTLVGLKRLLITGQTENARENYVTGLQAIGNSIQALVNELKRHQSYGDRDETILYPSERVARALSVPDSPDEVVAQLISAIESPEYRPVHLLQEAVSELIVGRARAEEDLKKARTALEKPHGEAVKAAIAALTELGSSAEGPRPREQIEALLENKPDSIDDAAAWKAVADKARSEEFKAFKEWAEVVRRLAEVIPEMPESYALTEAVKTAKKTADDAKEELDKANEALEEEQDSQLKALRPKAVEAVQKTAQPRFMQWYRSAPPVTAREIVLTIKRDLGCDESTKLESVPERMVCEVATPLQVARLGVLMSSEEARLAREVLDDTISLLEGQKAAALKEAQGETGEQLEKALRTAAQGRLALLGLCSAQSLPSASCETEKGRSAREVLDDTISQLEHQRIAALQQGRTEAARHLGKALRAARLRRSDLIDLSSATSFLRTSYKSTSLQRDASLRAGNLLIDGLLERLIPPRFRDDLDHRYQILQEVDKQFWQNVNRVRVRGAGDTNYVVVKDDIGNWYVKNFSSNPARIIQGAQQLAMFAAGAPPTGTREQERTDSDAEGAPRGGRLEALRSTYAAATARELEQLRGSIEVLPGNVVATLQLLGDSSGCGDRSCGDVQTRVDSVVEQFVQAVQPQEEGSAPDAARLHDAIVGVLSKLPALPDQANLEIREMPGTPSILEVDGKRKEAREKREDADTKKEERAEFIRQQTLGVSYAPEVIAEAEGRYDEARDQADEAEAELAELERKAALPGRVAQILRAQVDALRSRAIDRREKEITWYLGQLDALGATGQ